MKIFAHDSIQIWYKDATRGTDNTTTFTVRCSQEAAATAAAAFRNAQDLRNHAS